MIVKVTVVVDAPAPRFTPEAVVEAVRADIEEAVKTRLRAVECGLASARQSPVALVGVFADRRDDRGRHG